MSTDIITPEESVRLCQLEERFEICKATFLEGGAILSEIMKAKLYRQTYKSFEAYLKDRWDISPRRAYQLIEAANTVESVKNFTQNPPQTESQAKELSKAPKEQRPAAWERAQEIAKEEGKEKPAARHVEAAVLEVMPKDEPETVVVDGTQEDATPARRPHVKIIEDEGMNIWLLAKSHLDRINKNDSQREAALKACADYCNKRLQSKK